MLLKLHCYWKILFTVRSLFWTKDFFIATMSAKKSIGIRGKPLRSQTREVIANVLEFMQAEAQSGVQIPLANYKQRLLTATGIGKTSYEKIHSDLRKRQTGSTTAFISPKKPKNRPAPKTDLDKGEIETIRTIIHDFALIKKRQPTLRGNFFFTCLRITE